ncbi:MAG: hypothetical protein FWD64_01260, partial [Acidobacteriaceae bacterium]|nr:hypothetical protein [Acidobacteriaceae bacterium]
PNSLTFTAIPAKTLGDAPFTVSATSSTSSTGAITYSVVSGPATVSGNTVTLTGSGEVKLEAMQAADANFQQGTGQTSFTVNPAATTADFAVAVSPAAQSVLPGVAAKFAVNVASINGAYPCTVSFDQAHVTSVPELPAGSVVNFSPASVTPDGAATTMTVTIPLQKAELDTGGFGVKAPLALAALLLPLIAWRRRRTWGRLLVLLVLALAGSAAILGCSGGGNFVQPARTYTITVTGTSSCGGATRSSNQVTLMVGM